MLKKNWVDVKKPYAYSGVSKIRYYLGKEKSIKDIQNELSGIRTYTLHKEKKKIPYFNPYFIYNINQQWQMDICYPPNQPSHNSGFKYILCVLDVFSRKLVIEKIKSKDGKTVFNAFMNIRNTFNSYPETILSDKGGEFMNIHFKKFCKSENIKQMFSYNDTKAPHVERAQRSFQTILYKILEERQTMNYIDALSSSIEIYNNRVNRVTGFSPNEAYKKKNHDLVRSNLEKYYNTSLKNKKNPKFGAGDFVRIHAKSNVFQRGYQPQFTEEVFKIKKVLTNLPHPRYIIETSDSSEVIKGSFYEREITKASHDEFKIEKILKKRKRGSKIEYFVKWVGYPENRNSWIEAGQITKKFENGSKLQ